MGVFGGSPDKWRILRIEDGVVSKLFTFQYNPTDDNETLTADYDFNTSPGGVLPKAIFTSIGENSYSFTVFLDATEKYDPSQFGVGAQIDFFKSLALPDVNRYLSSIGQFVSPPEVVLARGSDCVQVVVTSVNVHVLRRNRVLHPTRAEIDVQMRAVFWSKSSIDRMLQYIGNNRALLETNWTGGVWW
jgi:hypothetical protein